MSRLDPEPCPGPICSLSESQCATHDLERVSRPDSIFLRLLSGQPDDISFTRSSSRKCLKAGAKAAVTALDGLTLDVLRRRNIRPCSGPNGAGKTTFIKVLLEIVFPDVGHAQRVARREPIGNTRKRKAGVGYLPENHRYPDFLTGEQVLRLLRQAQRRGQRMLLGEAHRRGAGAGGYDAVEKNQNPQVLQRHAAARRPGTGADQRSATRHPRRADGRRRSHRAAKHIRDILLAFAR
jgi:hypothetical protein